MWDKSEKSQALFNLSACQGLMLALFLSGCSTTPPTQEMSDARQSVEAAKQAGAVEHAPGPMDSAELLLNKAEVGLRSGNYEEAQQDAIAAKEAARQALAISEVKQIEPAPVASPPVYPKNKPVSAPVFISIEVTQGENLWLIAGKKDIYGDPLLWPLLLSSNADKISDADLIFPGQQLQINASPSHEEISAAKHHAQNRGVWRLGEIEPSDTKYLNR